MKTIKKVKRTVKYNIVLTPKEKEMLDYLSKEQDIDVQETFRTWLHDTYFDLRSKEDAHLLSD